MNPLISNVALLLALFWAGTLQAGTVLVIDDFNDPARLPGDESQRIVDGVGDLAARRSLIPYLEAGIDDPPLELKAEIDGTIPGHYYVDIAGGGLSQIHLVYDFPITDFTPYEAVILDISSWPEIPGDPNLAHVPSLRVVALEAFPRPFVYWLTRFVSPEERRAGRLILPLDSFTNRAGGPVDADWSVINQLQLTLGAHGGWGPWEIAIDRISLGPAIPEPSAAYLAAGCLGCFLIPRFAAAVATGKFAPLVASD